MNSRCHVNATIDDGLGVGPPRNDLLKGGVVNSEKLHAVSSTESEMPPVTDDLVEARWTDAMGTRRKRPERERLKKSAGATNLGLLVKYLPAKRSAGEETEARTRLRSCSLGITSRITLPRSLWSEPVTSLSFFPRLVPDQSGFVCHEVTRWFVTNNYVMN